MVCRRLVSMGDDSEAKALLEALMLEMTSVLVPHRSYVASRPSLTWWTFSISL